MHSKFACVYICTCVVHLQLWQKQLLLSRNLPVVFEDSKSIHKDTYCGDSVELKKQKL